MNQRNVERNRRLDALEAKIAALEGGHKGFMLPDGRPGYLTKDLAAGGDVVSSADLPSTLGNLEARLRQLESRPPLTYRDIWSPAIKYSPGDVVTSGNGMWYAKAESQGRRPGGDSSGTFWRLCVRQGPAGKDGRCACSPSEP